MKLQAMRTDMGLAKPTLYTTLVYTTLVPAARGAPRRAKVDGYKVFASKCVGRCDRRFILLREVCTKKRRCHSGRWALMEAKRDVRMATSTVQ